MEAIFTDPSKWDICERILLHLSAKDLANSSLINKNALALVTSSSAIQLVLRRAYHNLPPAITPTAPASRSTPKLSALPSASAFKATAFPESNTSTPAKESLQRLLSHQHNLALLRPYRLDSLNLTYAPTVAMEDGYLLLVDGVRSAEPMSFWVIEDTRVDIGLIILQLPKAGVVPTSARKGPWDAGGSEKVRSWTAMIGKPIIAVAAKASENLLAVVSPIPDEELVEGVSTAGRISFLCLHPPGRSLDEEWIPVPHPSAKRPYIDVMPGPIAPGSYKDAHVDPAAASAGAEADVTDHQDSAEDDGTMAINAEAFGISTEMNVEGGVPGAVPGGSAAPGGEGDQGDWEDEGDWEDDDDEDGEEGEDEPEEDEDLSRFNGKMVLLSINFGEDGMAWSDVLIAGWGGKRTLWWDWRKGVSLGMSEEGDVDYAVLEYGTVVLAKDTIPGPNGQVVVKERASIEFFKTAPPLEPARQCIHPSPERPDPLAFSISDIPLVTRELTLALFNRSSRLKPSGAIVECRSPAFGRSTTDEGGFRGDRLLIGLDMSIIPGSKPVNQIGEPEFAKHLWGSIAVKDMLDVYNKHRNAREVEASDGKQLKRAVIDWPEWGGAFDGFGSHSEHQYAFAARNRMLLVEVIEEDFTETLLTDQLLYMEIFDYSPEAANSARPIPSLAFDAEFYRPLAGGSLVPKTQWADMNPPWPECEEVSHYYPIPVPPAKKAKPSLLKGAKKRKPDPPFEQIPEIIFRRTDLPEEEVEEGSEQELFKDVCARHRPLADELVSLGSRQAETGSKTVKATSRERAIYGLRPGLTVEHMDFDGERLVICFNNAETGQSRISILTF